MPARLQAVLIPSRIVFQIDRLVYDIVNDEIVIMSCRFHYEDK
ncbi:MAG: type II toxin-antitoxin system YoeB family toxin [Lachnospiraceae bacterium]|nr:type II toxin-antitoxin system YoeB family toxin [Lachnospiraceae bacterium]